VRFFESIAFYCYERFQVGGTNSRRDHAGEQAQSNFGAAVEILCDVENVAARNCLAPIILEDPER
jgi:hypothetical protein